MDDVIQWMRDHHTGYKQAAAHFGVPYEQVKEAARARARYVPGPGRGNTHEGSDPSEDLDTGGDQDVDVGDTPGDDQDPLAANYEDVLASRIKYAQSRIRHHESKGRPQIAHKWEGTLARYRKDLETYREARRKADEAKGKTAEQDPVQLARRLAKGIKKLASLAPREIEEACCEALRVLGRTVVPKGEEWGPIDTEK